jgi:RNA polymerase sigma-32 factor
MARAQEHRLAVRFHETGDGKCLQRLVNANLRLVVKIALEYRSSRRDLLDLVQEGNLGLIHAVRKYDPNRSVKLSTYAAWWIRAYMLKFILSNARLVKVGTTLAQRKLFFGLRRVQAELEGQNRERVGAGQIAAALSVPERVVEEMKSRLSFNDVSLDGPAHEGDDRPRMDIVRAETLGPDDELETSEFRDIVSREVHAFGRTLTGRDALIFRERMVCEQPATFAEIADQFQVSPERIRQIEVHLKERLRDRLRATLGDAVPAVA